jgi:HlyD family secretion protein
MKSRKRLFIGLGLLITLISLLIIGKKLEWWGKEKPTEVETSTVSSSNLLESVSASGKIQPEVEVKISPDVSGEIIALYVKEGESVKKGQLLLKIKPENYVSAVDRSKAQVNQSKAGAEQAKAAIARAESQVLRATMDYNRQKQLLADKLISQSDFETSETNLKIAKQDLDASKASFEASRFGVSSAEAALKDADENLRKTNIYAPMDGVISKLAVELGERVVGTSQMAGTEMLRIANLNNMEVRVNVNENDIVKVGLGDTVIVDVDAYTASGKKFKGKVTQIANSANGLGTGAAGASSASSTESVTEFEVRIRILPESYGDLINEEKGIKYPFKPGMTATVDIVTNSKNAVISIPISAVTVNGRNSTEDNGDSFENLGKVKDESQGKNKKEEIVFVMKNGKAEIKKVKTGITDTNLGLIEIITGLSKGETIISGPFDLISNKLKEGDKVEVKKEKKDKK